MSSSLTITNLRDGRTCTHDAKKLRYRIVRTPIGSGTRAREKRSNTKVIDAVGRYAKYVIRFALSFYQNIFALLCSTLIENFFFFLGRGYQNKYSHPASTLYVSSHINITICITYYMEFRFYLLSEYLRSHLYMYVGNVIMYNVWQSARALSVYK